MQLNERKILINIMAHSAPTACCLAVAGVRNLGWGGAGGWDQEAAYLSRSWSCSLLAHQLTCPMNQVDKPSRAKPSQAEPRESKRARKVSSLLVWAPRATWSHLGMVILFAE